MKFTLIEKEYSSSYRPGEGGERNGSNYPQPTYRLKDDKGNDWLLFDTSCGDFGGRYNLYRNGEQVARWGSMYEKDGLREFSLLSGHCARKLAEATGKQYIPCGGVRTYERED